MTSLEADPMDDQELAAEKDTTSSATLTSQRAYIHGKRRFDDQDDFVQPETTPAKLYIKNGDARKEPQADDDDDGFTLVQHRRKRTTGIPVLLTPTQESSRLQHLNPLKLSEELKAAAGATFVRHRFTAKGGLLVDVTEPATVNRLLKIHSIGEIAVLATIPKAYMQNNGLIEGVPDWYSNSQLTEFLGPIGVIAARRLYQRYGKPGEAAKPTDRVVITFRPNTERPTKVSLGFTRHEVIDYVEAPPRCFNCQALGHVAKYCKENAKCKHCSGTHSTKDCKGESPVKCSNCGGNHPADYVNCKARLQALAKKKLFVRGPDPIKTTEGQIVEPGMPSSSTAHKEDEVTVEVDTRYRPPKYKAKKQRASPTSTTGQQKEASLETNDMVTSSPKTANAPAAQVPSEGATGRRLYSKVVTDTRPPQSTTRSQQGSMAIGDIISFIFSVLPKFVAILPPGIFKTILQGAMLLQPAIVEMTRNLQQCHG